MLHFDDWSCWHGISITVVMAAELYVISSHVLVLAKVHNSSRAKQWPWMGSLMLVETAYHYPNSQSSTVSVCTKVYNTHKYVVTTEVHFELGERYASLLHNTLSIKFWMNCFTSLTKSKSLAVYSTLMWISENTALHLDCNSWSSLSCTGETNMWKLAQVCKTAGSQ